MIQWNRLRHVRHAWSPFPVNFLHVRFPQILVRKSLTCWDELPSEGVTCLYVKVWGFWIGVPPEVEGTQTDRQKEEFYSGRQTGSGGNFRISRWSVIVVGQCGNGSNFGRREECNFVVFQFINPLRRHILEILRSYHGAASYCIDVNIITVNFAYQEALTRTKMSTSF